MSTKTTINLPDSNPAIALMELERQLDISLVHMTVVTTIRIDHNSGAKEFWMVIGDKLRKVEVSILPNSMVEDRLSPRGGCECSDPNHIAVHAPSATGGRNAQELVDRERY